MRDFTKGVVATAVVALICKECYAKGWNNAMKNIDQKLDLMQSVHDSVKNKEEKSV